MGASLQVAIVAYDGVDELDLSGVLSPLAKAAGAAPAGAGLRVTIIGPGPFRGSSGLLMTPDQTFGDACDFAALNAVVLPGGKGAQTAAHDPALSRFVLDARAAGAPFYAVCSGLLILRDLRLLEGLHVACHRQKRQMLAEAKCTLGSGLIRDRWLVSAGGFGPGESLKAAEIAFCLLADIAPEQLMAVAQRMELWPQINERRYEAEKAGGAYAQGVD